ncbi:GtrA family protein [Sphingomonas sp. IC081]|uniref:GtrA family protein n=1 Tax=Sphingomonas sp. IC081 TaxID=304378 RepID=UPI0011598E4D|nr:GtrA family protein [Sphingomonas sp. IC081]QDK34789.1 GtrA family protein [Sphingomonas sp. IC081]
MSKPLAQPEGAPLQPAGAPLQPAGGPALAGRLLSRRVAAMLARNTAVSIGVFLVGLGILWLLVERLAVGAVGAAGVSFLVSNSLHYVIGRAWIFPGSARGIHAGYWLFLANSGIGLLLTMALFAALLCFTPMHYLIARTLVSVIAGLAVFLLNAVLNFRQV